MSCHRYTVSLGSNDGDRRRHINDALTRLMETGEVSAYSDIYETAAINGRDADYMNAVAVVRSQLPPEQFTDVCKRVERYGGRNRSSKLTGRIPIDIDVVIIDTTVIRPADFSQLYFTRGYYQIINNERYSAKN